MEAHDLPNIGIITATAPADLMQIVNDEVLKIQSNFDKATPTNNTLVGNILREYVITDSRDAIKKQVTAMASLHQERYSSSYNVGLEQHQINKKNQPMKLELGNTWVNFQQKGEFNPIHNHTGMYSFVLWVKIPYFSNFEEATGPGRKSNSNRAGKFEFTYNNILGNITGSIIDVDKTYEGQIVLFPALLNHQVFPFYSSNDYRISIAGNLFFAPLEDDK